MRSSKFVFGLALIGILGIALSGLDAQEKKAEPAKKEPPKEAKPAGDKPAIPAMPEMPADMAKQMEAWTKLAAPGEHHKALEPFIGEWETTTRMYMGGPGTPPMESKGTSSVKWVLGGRYLMEEHKGQFMGQPFEGIGTMGYNNFRNVYVGTWMDNTSTALFHSVGSVDHDTKKTITLYMEMDEPSLNVVGRMVKAVHRITDQDHHVMEMYDLHVGDNYKVFEIVYSRKK